jgi:hypothetical protein
VNDDGGAKNALADTMRQNGASNKANQTASEGQECGFSEKQGSYGGVSRAQ